MNFLRKLPPLLLRRRAQVICILAGLLLYLAAVLAQPAETDLKGGRYLPRSSYGGRMQHYEIEVEGLGEASVSVDVPVSGRIWLDSEDDERIIYLNVSKRDRFPGEGEWVRLRLYGRHVAAVLDAREGGKEGKT